MTSLTDIGRLIGGGVAAVTEMSERYTKDEALNRMRTEFEQIPVEWIQRWGDNEWSLADHIINKYGGQLTRPLKGVAIQAINSISSQELLQIANETRPELSHIWNSTTAMNRMEQERIKIREHISRS